MTVCPCGSTKNYAECCGKYIDHQAIPATPEALMRSRYTAYTQANVEYIAETMKYAAAKNFNPQEARAWAQQVQWIKLEVLHATTQENKGIVEFIAYYQFNQQSEKIHEISEFLRENGRWYYVDKKRISRNDLCPCGSGKKYKKCCSTNG